jgi:uncharacterized protein YeaO (DUF488 family)
LPNLAPSTALLSTAKKIASNVDWKKFAGRYEREMSQPDARRLLDLLAALSHRANFSVGCYCENEDRCHRSVLKRLLQQRGAKVTQS